MRDDFRVFRSDRIRAIAETEEVFLSEPGKTYEDYVTRVEREKENDCSRGDYA